MIHWVGETEKTILFYKENCLFIPMSLKPKCLWAEYYRSELENFAEQLIKWQSVHCKQIEWTTRNMKYYPVYIYEHMAVMPMGTVYTLISNILIGTFIRLKGTLYILKYMFVGIE